MGVAQAPRRIGKDPGFGGAPPLGTSERIYAGLLRAYPGTFRRRYEDEMVLLFADTLRDARAANGAAGTSVTWCRTLLDLASSALGEHLRKDRTMAQSLATFEPTRTMRLLGLFGLVGGALLLWVWLAWNPFADRTANTFRLLAFWLAGSTVPLAFYGRQAVRAPRLALVATAAVVLTSLWNLVWLFLAIDRDSPFAGVFGWAGFIASFSGWLAAGLYGLAVLLIRAAWQGMVRWASVLTRLAAAALVIGGPMAPLGMDYFGLTRSEPYGEVIGSLGAIGVSLVGAAWLLLGVVLLLGGRGVRGTNATA